MKTTKTPKTQTGNITINNELQNGYYVAISTFHLKDDRLTLAEKGLLTILLSLPKSWKIKKSKMSHYLNIDRNTFKKMLNNLINLGYVETKKINHTTEEYIINSTSTHQREFNIFEIKHYTEQQLNYFLLNKDTPPKYKKAINHYLTKYKEFEKELEKLIEDAENETF